jgi:hypothetical protein
MANRQLMEPVSLSQNVHDCSEPSIRSCWSSRLPDGRMVQVLREVQYVTLAMVMCLVGKRSGICEWGETVERLGVSTISSKTLLTRYTGAVRDQVAQSLDGLSFCFHASGPSLGIAIW